MPGLSAGVGVATVTPPVGYVMHCLGLRREPSVGVHDDLRAKALVLEGEGGPLAVVSLDIVYIPRAVVEDIRRRVTALTGICGERVMLACTHNHTTPDFPENLGEETAQAQGYDKYRPLFVELVAGAVSQAYHRLQPARLGSAAGRLSGWTTNRRHPERAIDDTLGVIRVDREDGEPLACLVSWACHTLAVGGQYRLWTADYPAYAAQVIERAHPRATFMFLQGAHGDVLPFDWAFGKADSRVRATYENARRLGYALGGEALRLMQQIETSGDARLGVASVEARLPGRTLPWSLEEARAVLEETIAANPGWQSERWTEAMDHGNSALLAPGYYRVAHARSQVSILASVPREMPAQLQVFRLGEAAIAANPGELFNSLGAQIKENSPFPHTLLATCANGSVGYIPARRDYEDLEGLPLRELVDAVRYRYLYGVATAMVNPGAGELVVEATQELLRGQRQEPLPPQQ